MAKAVDVTKPLWQLEFSPGWTVVWRWKGKEKALGWWPLFSPESTEGFPDEVVVFVYKFQAERYARGWVKRMADGKKPKREFRAVRCSMVCAAADLEG